MNSSKFITGRKVGNYLTENLRNLIDSGIATLDSVKEFNDELVIVRYYMSSPYDLFNKINEWITAKSIHNQFELLCRYLDCFFVGEDCTEHTKLDHCAMELVRSNRPVIHYFKERVKESLFYNKYAYYHGI